MVIPVFYYFLLLITSTNGEVKSKNVTNLTSDWRNMTGRQLGQSASEEDGQGIVGINTTGLDEWTTVEPVLEEWGGNCTQRNWKKCSKMKVFSSYIRDENKPGKEMKYVEIDCRLQPILCLKNKWTVTRCQILCMGKCNKGMDISNEIRV